MRIKSRAGKDVYFEFWSTPLNEAEWVWISSILQTKDRIHFFFRFNTDSAKEIHVLTTERHNPYRLIEERYAVACVNKNLVPAKKMKDIFINSKGRPLRTWKLWGTQYIKEIDENSVLSSENRIAKKNIVQYLIQTQDDCVEFITQKEPRWKSYKKSKLEDLLVYYAKKTRDK